MKRNHFKTLIFCALWCVMIFSQLVATAQETKVEGSLESVVPTDSNVRIGTLENGMKYYIRQNSKPENRVELRLVVNAGSILEDDNQRGLAHFIEHMAFNGTKNFKKNELVSYLQSIGVEFGADLNAYTSFDETVYMLPIPTDNPELVEKGLQILEDWAHQVEFTEEEIDKERGVVIEEWRLGRGANQRMLEKWLPIYLKDSRYAERLPIGTKEVIENASYETVRKFYQDWYRPDLMAIIAVGDVDPDEMEQKIKDQFGNIPAKENPRERMYYDVPGHEETYVVFAKDEEASFTQIQLIYKKEKEEEKGSLADLRQQIVYQCYNGMINQRLNELRQKADPPFIFGGTSYGDGIARTTSEYSSFAAVGEGGVLKGLRTLLEENERVLKYGFTPGELERFKKNLLTRYEQAYNERDKTESRRLVQEYINNFLEDEPIPGIEFEYEFLQKILPTIELEEINKLAKQWITDDNRVVIVTGPDKEGLEYPTEQDIRNLLEEVETAEIAPYEDKLAGAQLMPEKPQAGSVESELKLKDVEITKLTLSNGIEVYLRPTDFKNDEILFSAYSEGGHSLYPDEMHITASNAGQMMAQSGISEFSATDLQKLLAGKNASASAYISTYSEGMNGDCAPKDLETMLQLIHLSFTQPREDKEAFQSAIQRNKMLFGNLMANPNFYFSDQVSRIMTQNHPRAGGFPTPEEMDKVELDKVHGIYKERFANAADFKFFFVGNFDIEEMKPMLAQYLGSLPAEKGAEESYKDLGIRPPEGKVEKVINKGTDPKSLVQIRFTGEFDGDRYEAYLLDALAEVLNIKLIEILREEKGGVYGVGASGFTSRIPYKNYSFNISFPCGPENVDQLIAATFEEIENIVKKGPTEEDVAKVKEQQKRSREENLEQNRYWLNQIRSYVTSDRGFDTFYQYDEFVGKLNAKDLKKIAKKFLDTDEYIQIVLMPEEGTEEEENKGDK